DISAAAGGASIVSLSGNGNVSLGTNNLTLSNGSSTFAGTISGSGGLALGGGTEILSGANTYTGGTTVSAGTLQLGNGGTTGSITGDVSDNGILAFDRSDAVTFGSVISGSGSLTKAGSGTLALTGANSYAGGTTLTTGMLQLGNASAIGTGTLAMAEFTSIGFTSSFTLANDITLSGDPTVDVGSGLTTTLSGGISDGTQPGDLVKTGSGTLVLTGVDTYTGSTTVAAGTLDVAGSLASSVSVDSGATLTGTGSTGGMTVGSGSIVTPGGSAIGTLTVNGNVHFASDASYHVDASDSGSSDQIHATGTATLGGGSVVALAAGSNWAASTRYTIVTGDGGVSGNFGTASSNFAFLTPTLSYDANHAYLILARNAVAFPSVGITANQVQTAGAVEALGSSNAVYDAVLPLAAGPARAAFNQLAGDSLASTRTAIVDDSHYVRDAINNHLRGVQGAGGISKNDDQGSAWASTWGHGGNHDSDGNAAATHGNGSGLLLGADRDLGAWRVGAVAGLGQLSNRTDGTADAHSTSTVAGLYSGLDLGAWQLQGGVAHSGYRTDSHRTIAVAGLAGVASASYHNGVTQAYVDGGYRIRFAQGSLTPYLDLARVRLHQDAINESGNPAALHVQASTSNVNYGTVGLRGVHDSTSGTQLYANLGFQHAWGDLSAINRQTFAQGGIGSFTVDGLPVAMNAGIVDLGIRFNVASNVTVDAGYHGQFASDATDQGARMALNIRF
ncbi:autotransporter domain-containing protein, partial [Rhodanobacter ginsengisoli]